MGKKATPERTFLKSGVKKLQKVLRRHRFSFGEGEEGFASGGPFAVGFFRRGGIEIGLIVRGKSELGCPNYSVGRGFAAHQDLVWALGGGRERLVPGPGLSFVARDGGDPFEALCWDLEQIILPVLAESEEAFRATLARAVKRGQRRLSGRIAPSAG